MTSMCIAIDPTDPRFWEDPDDAIRWLHAEQPVYRCDLRPRFPDPFWIVSRWEDIRLVGTDPDLFTTRYGVGIKDALFVEDNIAAPDDPRLAVGMRLVTYYDRPEHVRVRGAVNRSFRPARVERMEPLLRRLVGEALDRIRPGEVTDFAPIAAAIPRDVICTLLGIDAAGGHDFDRWIRAIGESFEPDAEGDWEAVVDMFDFFEAEIAARRETPREDLISDFLAAEWKGERLSHEEILMWCWAIFAGGQATSAYLIAGGLRTLLEHPAQAALVIEEPARTKDAVAELLRWLTPLRYICHTATASTEIRGVPIARGERVMMCFPFANRDPDVFENPYRFDVTRTQNDALSFGVGPHHCIGSKIARLEARVVFEELFARFPATRLAGPVARRPTAHFNSIDHLPVRFAR